MHFPFKELSPVEEALLGEVLAAHEASAERDNISRTAVQYASFGSGDYGKAIASAILTLGGVHAPLERTGRFLLNENPALLVPGMVQRKEKIPGWGNSFVTGSADPLWATVHERIESYYPDFGSKLSDVTEALALAGKPVFPNPSAYTAIAAIVLSVPLEVAPYLFILGRLGAWTQQAALWLNRKENVWV